MTTKNWQLQPTADPNMYLNTNSFSKSDNGIMITRMNFVKETTRKYNSLD